MSLLKNKKLNVITLLSAALLSFSAWAISLDDAKNQGLVGEDSSGYLGLVVQNAEAKAVVDEINAKRNEWMDVLQQNGISTRPATHAVHMLEFYREKYELTPGDYPSAWAANDCSISLPLFHGMSEAEQDYVIQHVLRHTP